MADRAENWKRLIDTWSRSGLSQAEFCRQRDIKLVTFGWWKRKLRGLNKKIGGARVSSSLPKTRCTSSVDTRWRTRRADGRLGHNSPAKFVEVAWPRNADPAGAPSALPEHREIAVPSYEIALRNGHVIRVPEHFNAAAVSELIAAVASC